MAAIEKEAAVAVGNLAAVVLGPCPDVGVPTPDIRALMTGTAGVGVRTWRTEE